MAELERELAAARNAAAEAKAGARAVARAEAKRGHDQEPGDLARERAAREEAEAERERAESRGKLLADTLEQLQDAVREAARAIPGLKGGADDGASDFDSDDYGAEKRGDKPVGGAANTADALVARVRAIGAAAADACKARASDAAGRRKETDEHAATARELAVAKARRPRCPLGLALMCASSFARLLIACLSRALDAGGARRACACARRSRGASLRARSRGLGSSALLSEALFLRRNAQER